MAVHQGSEREDRHRARDMPVRPRVGGSEPCGQGIEAAKHTMQTAAGGIRLKEAQPFRQGQAHAAGAAMIMNRGILRTESRARWVKPASSRTETERLCMTASQNGAAAPNSSINSKNGANGVGSRST